MAGQAEAKVEMAPEESIAGALEAMSVRRCSTLTELWGLAVGDVRAAVSARFVVAPKLRVLEHHDLAPALIVYDPGLAVIGLVEFLDLGSAHLVTELTQHIDRAAYLRQLCLIEGERARKHALTVELVLVLRGGEALDYEDRVGTVLRRIARETGYFRVIGVNLLYEQPDGTYRESDVRRAFCWLLADTRKWLAGARESEPPRLSLKLVNYRLPGVRKYRFAAEAAFHVIHGSNGSGKTSLSESLELLATGTVERLQREPAYFPNVRYRPKGTAPGQPLSAARLALHSRSSGSSRGARAVVAEQPPSPDASDHRVLWRPETPPLLSADSFRLDQVLMDRLVRCDEVTRAALFLRAFFPEDRPLFDALA
ncbi:MAG TPA: hypothetical protein DEH78_07525, partial [Solibacterales bacterium]|nr:hypothetical protein [Bryobacterales bacterium]